jgi:hypothetical protein
MLPSCRSMIVILRTRQGHSAFSTLPLSLSLSPSPRAARSPGIVLNVLLPRDCRVRQSAIGALLPLGSFPLRPLSISTESCLASARIPRWYHSITGDGSKQARRLCPQSTVGRGGTVQLSQSHCPLIPTLDSAPESTAHLDRPLHS